MKFPPPVLEDVFAFVEELSDPVEEEESEEPSEIVTEFNVEDSFVSDVVLPPDECVLLLCVSVRFWP